MIYEFLPLLLDVDDNPIISGAKKAVGSGAPSNLPMPAASRWGTLIFYIAIFAAAYYFFIRPQKKQHDKLIEFQNNLKPGDDIITSSGLHGKIININDQTALVEFGVNKGIRIPVTKGYIISMDNELAPESNTESQSPKS